MTYLRVAHNAVCRLVRSTSRAVPLRLAGVDTLKCLGEVHESRRNEQVDAARAVLSLDTPVARRDVGRRPDAVALHTHRPQVTSVSSLRRQRFESSTSRTWCVLSQ